MRNLLLGLMVCILAACTSKMNLQEGIKSFQVQDFRQAFIRLRPEADKGSPEAQYAIGYMYYYGYGVIENRQKAWYWITTAAKNGNEDAVKAMQVLQKSAGKTDQSLAAAKND